MPVARFRRPRLAAALLLASCQHEAATRAAPASLATSSASASADPQATELQALSARLAASLSTREEALWSAWTTGAAPDLSKAPLVATREALALLQQAHPAAPLEARRRAHLEHFVVGELLARELFDDNAALANLEASATFTLDGKDYAWRDLTRLLVHEKSAVKRRALWAQSLSAAERLDAALAHRDQTARTVLGSLGATSALELAAEARELDLDALGRAAVDFLDATDGAWARVVERRAHDELKLKPATLTRADLPRLARVPETVDAAFPRAKTAERALALLAGLGLANEAGLTLELSEAPRKNPLPLTVAPRGVAEVRVSARPVGGLRDQAALLSELGHAEALRHVTAAGWEFARLGDPGLTHVSGELLAGLLESPEVLVAMGVEAGLAPAVAQAAREDRLLALRREAGALLARLDTAGLPEADARPRALAIWTRALGVKHTPADGVRVRLDGDEDLRTATAFRASLLAEVVRAKVVAALGEGWWHSPAAGKALQALWAPGTSVPTETQLGLPAEGVAGLVRRLVGEPRASPGPVDAGPSPSAAPEVALEGDASPAADGGSRFSDGG